jgi:hypothetical protein
MKTMMWRVGTMIGGWLRSGIVRDLAAVLLAGLLPLGLVQLGEAARQSLRTRDRFALAFADIDCVPPGDLSRAEFLDEVQYLAGIPERLRLLDEDLAPRMAEAFAHHPWVEQVSGVERTRPRGLRVTLKYRTPVLAVVERGGSGDRETTASYAKRPRATDRQGTVLPARAYREDLPHFVTTTPPGTAGTRWHDPAVWAAARLADYLRPYQDRLRVQELAIEGSHLILWSRARTSFVWGAPPGSERAGEEAAVVKVRRLLDLQGWPNEPPDPRPRATAPSRRPLAFRADQASTSSTNRDHVSNSSR